MWSKSLFSKVTDGKSDSFSPSCSEPLLHSGTQTRLRGIHKDGLVLGRSKWSLRHHRAKGAMGAYEDVAATVAGGLPPAGWRSGQMEDDLYLERPLTVITLETIDRTCNMSLTD